MIECKGHITYMIFRSDACIQYAKCITSNHGETDKLRLRSILQYNCPVLFKSVKVMEKTRQDQGTSTYWGKTKEIAD